jgi:hypothetical protein
LITPTPTFSFSDFGGQLPGMIPLFKDPLSSIPVPYRIALRPLPPSFRSKVFTFIDHSISFMLSSDTMSDTINNICMPAVLIEVMLDYLLDERIFCQLNCSMHSLSSKRIGEIMNNPSTIKLSDPWNDHKNYETDFPRISNGLTGYMIRTHLRMSDVYRNAPFSVLMISLAS